MVVTTLMVAGWAGPGACLGALVWTCDLLPPEPQVGSDVDGRSIPGVVGLGKRLYVGLIE